MPAIDHLVFAVPELQAGVALIADLTGVEAVAGGVHPGAGTRNALASFDDETYFEIISVDPDQPEPAHPRPFGVDPSRPARMAGFAIHPTGDETIEGLAATMAGHGLAVGPVTAMSRLRPDGVELRWRLTLGRPVKPTGVEPAPDGAGTIPFVIDWGETETPARTAPRMGRLQEIILSVPDPSTAEALRSLSITFPGGEVQVANGAPELTAVVVTPERGAVSLG